MKHSYASPTQAASAKLHSRPILRRPQSSNRSISSSNLLEQSLGVTLFKRTHSGLTLTKAGESLYTDAKYIIQYCRDAVTRARNAMLEDATVLRIGTSPMTPAQLLMPLWPHIQEQCPDLKFQIVPFDNTPENARDILAHLGERIDVVVGIFDDVMLRLRQCAGLELSREPFCCALSIHHPLAAKDRLRTDDLQGQNFLMMRKGWSESVDRLREDLLKHVPSINIIDFDFYSTEVFNRCENTPDVLLAIPSWASVHPLLKVMPVDWDYSIPYGLLHAEHPTDTVQRFLTAADSAARGFTPQG